MSLTKDEVRELRRIYDRLREFPAFENVIFRRCKLKGLYGAVTVREDGKKVVLLSSQLNFTDTLHTLAHECAHILVDLNNQHNEFFNIMLTAMEKVIKLIYYEA